jgi:hypothetical protein
VSISHETDRRITMKFGRHAAAWLMPLLLVVPMMTQAVAQTAGPAQGTVAPEAVTPDTDGNYTQQQLDQMLAPIALYPDKLLMNILMASTFPDQLTQAQAWLAQPGNGDLKGDALLDALKPLTWDPSIKAIVQFPQIVDLLVKNPNWTQGLGASFDNQQDEVLAQVQFLRQQAQKSGNLQSNDKMVVQNDGPNIVVQPANPDVVYAPYYNPAVVYGPWPWAAYPPVFFPPVYFGLGPLGIGVGWGWGPGWAIAPPLWGWYGVGWGYGGGIFFNAGFGPRFGWYGHGWGGGGWRGGGWRHGGGGHWGHPGYHGRSGFHGRGPGGGRGGHPGGGRGGRPGGHPGGGRGGHPGGVHPGGGRGGHPGGVHPGGGRGGHPGGVHPGGGRGGRPGGGFGGGGRRGVGGGGGGGHRGGGGGGGGGHRHP